MVDQSLSCPGIFLCEGCNYATRLSKPDRLVCSMYLESMSAEDLTQRNGVSSETKNNERIN